MAALTVQNLYKKFSVLTTQACYRTGKYRNHMKNRFLSVDLHKGASLLLALVLALQMTGYAEANVIKTDELTDDTPTDNISELEFTTQIIHEATVTEDAPTKTVILQLNDTTEVIYTTVETPIENDVRQPPKSKTLYTASSITAESAPNIDAVFDEISEIKPAYTQGQDKIELRQSSNSIAPDTASSKPTGNALSTDVAFDEINEIKPAYNQGQEEIELVQQNNILGSELFLEHSKPADAAVNENQTITENLEETIRNSVKNEIEVEQNISSTALLDVLQEIPELEIRRSLANEILLVDDPQNEDEKAKRIETISNDFETQKAAVKLKNETNIEAIEQAQEKLQHAAVQTERAEKSLSKTSNSTRAAKSTDDVSSSALDLHTLVFIPQESSASASEDYKRKGKNLGESENELDIGENDAKDETNKHLTGIFQNHLESYDDDMHSKNENIPIVAADVNAKEFFGKSTNISQDLKSITDNESNLQYQSTSQPLSIEIKESISSNVDTPDILTVDSNDLLEEILSIDKVTEASAYIESDLKASATLGDNPHYIIKKQGVQDIQSNEYVKSSTDYVDVITELPSEVTDQDGTTEEDILVITTQILNTDRDELESDDNTTFAEIIGEENKNISNIMPVASPPSNSLSSNDAATVEEISEALLSHSIKGAIYPYSLYSKRHSTLILCSISALVLLFLLLTIFLKLERHHGTLDIEMQEQRCGKDQLDEEFEKCLKLLDVEASIPVPAEADESEECLQTTLN